jgi:heme/copper-type cytochrome/quinol oxidase subunit 3
MERLKTGPEDALPVSTVIKGKGRHPPYFFGTALLILIEAIEFGALIASYFYLRSSTNDWPPGDTPMPELVVSSLATLIILVSAIPNYLADKRIKKDDRRGLVICYVISAVLGAIMIAMLIVHLARLNYKWTSNAYSSIYWTLIGSFLILFAIEVLETVYILVLAAKGFYNSERHAAVEVDGITWYFAVAVWIAIYITVFLSPYFLS